MLYIVDTSLPEPWEQIKVLQFELEQFNKDLITRPSAIVANKMDLEKSKSNLDELKRFADEIHLPLFPISAQEKMGILPLLLHVRTLYDDCSTKEIIEDSNA